MQINSYKCQGIVSAGIILMWASFRKENQMMWCMAGVTSAATSIRMNTRISKGKYIFYASQLPQRLLEKHIQETNTKDLYFDAITFSWDTLGPLSTIKLYTRLKNNAKALKNVMKNVMKM